MRYLVTLIAVTSLAFGTLGCDVDPDLERDILLEQSAGYRLPFG